MAGRIVVIGHKNPDTDSICAAVAFAELLRHLRPREQIVAGVQIALQQQGYYTWAIDGKMGPLTRAAIARYQRDHRLPITSGIDPATLGSLGVMR